MKNHCVIITGGKFYPKFAANYLQKNPFDFLIAVDHGVEGAAMLGLAVDLLIGDFDSAEPGILEGYIRAYHPEIVKHPPEKDFTDTELAIDTAIRLGAQKITILGASGTRIDHMLGSIHNLKMAYDAGIECFLVDPCNRIRMAGAPLTIAKEESPYHYLSLIPFTEKVCGLTIEGTRYTVSDYTLCQGVSLGVSNEITAEEASIRMEEGILLVIESNDRPQVQE